MKPLLAASLLAASLWAQGPPPADGPPMMGRGRAPGGPSRQGHGPPPRQGFPFNEKWWTDPLTIRVLGLTDDQQHRIDDTFQKNRLRLIDLKANLEKEEALLEPLLSAEHPDEAAVTAHIDRVAGARAELEKANARMLLGFRLVLTAEQWRKLQSRDRSLH